MNKTLRALLALSCCALVSAAELPTVEQFFAKPQFDTLKLSPSGQQVAVTGTINGVEYFATINLQTLQSKPIGEVKNSHVLNYWWKGEDTILLLLQVSTYGESYHVVDLKTGKTTRSYKLDRAGQVINTLPDDPDNVLVTAESVTHPSLAKFNVKTLQIETIQRNPGGADTWITDKNGNPLAVLGAEDKVAFVWWRKSPEAKWERRNLGSDLDPQLLIGDNHPDQKRVLAWKFRPKSTSQIVAIDLETMAEELVFEAPGVDVSAIASWGDYGGTPREIYYETDRPHWFALDDRTRQLQTTIDRTLPQTINRVTSTSADGSVLLIHAWNETDYGSYYALDLKKGRMQVLGMRRPEMSQVKLSPSRAFQFTARDGLALSGRVYLPVSNPVKPPLIVVTGSDVLPGRATYGTYDYIQLLASRGYAVALVNYRGTTGFGRAYSDAGDRQLGTGMPNDIEDGVRYLIDAGLVDEKRIALLGQFDGGMIGFQTLLHSSLFAAWLNIDTQMVADDLGSVNVMASEHDPDKRQSLLGGRFAFTSYLESLSPKPHLAEIRIPSFHYYFRNTGDNSLICHGTAARQFSKESRAPSVFLSEEVAANFSYASWNMSDIYDTEYIDIYKHMLEFLNQHMPANIPGK